MAARKFPQSFEQLVDSRGTLLRKLLRAGYELEGVNDLSQYYDTVENSLKRLKANPKARLSNQEAYTLSAAWRKHSYDGAWVAEYPFSDYDATTVIRWYRRQSRKATRNLPKVYRPLIAEFKKYQRKHAGSEKAKRYVLAFKPDEAGNPFRRFSSFEALERFLALPHYKEARDRISGSFALVKVNAKGKPVKTLKEINV